MMMPSLEGMGINFVICKSCGYLCHRLSRDEKLFNRDLKQALVESESSSNHKKKPAILSQQESVSSDLGSASEVSDYFPGGCSESDEDFEPSPLPTKTAKNSTKPNSKLKTSTRAVPKKQQVKKEVGKVTTKTAPKKQQVSNTCKPLEALDSASLPGSKPAVVKSRPAAKDIKMTGASESVTEKVVKRSVGPPRRKWVPPSRVEDSKTTISSPQGRISGAPVIRVGLSRKAPIKPLHQTPLRTKN